MGLFSSLDVIMRLSPVLPRHSKDRYLQSSGNTHASPFSAHARHSCAAKFRVFRLKPKLGHSHSTAATQSNMVAVGRELGRINLLLYKQGQWSLAVRFRRWYVLHNLLIQVPIFLLPV